MKRLFAAALLALSSLAASAYDLDIGQQKELDYRVSIFNTEGYQPFSQKLLTSLVAIELDKYGIRGKDVSGKSPTRATLTVMIQVIGDESFNTESIELALLHPATYTVDGEERSGVVQSAVSVNGAQNGDADQGLFNEAIRSRAEEFIQEIARSNGFQSVE
ncbi:hypothetical protein [Microbulbifer sp. ALW1]|uniref:hypothetical protein n=1 Tax=Microbulbifer sp. (strain ALW1) TaxID=1516059 RepID=UPI001357666E|nr:hypothetical protein [Microbulbifer sp. ALW1]